MGLAADHSMWLSNKMYLVCTEHCKINDGLSTKPQSKVPAASEQPLIQAAAEGSPR